MATVNKETANPYLKQYFISHDLKDGDDWIEWGYMQWIEAMHDKFRQKYCLLPDIPYTPDEQELFIQWLTEKTTYKNEEGENMKFVFDTHGGDSELNHRTGQTVEILRELTEQECDIADVGRMFHVRFEDGLETDAFAYELTEKVPQ